MPRGNFHPSRTSQSQKMERKRMTDKLLATRKKTVLKPLDPTKPNWSLQK